MESQLTQGAYERTDGRPEEASLEQRIYQRMLSYLVEDLGRERVWAESRSRAEADGTHARRVCEELERNKIDVRGKSVLEVGAGMGGVAAELQQRGATVVALEPGAGWRTLAGERCRSLKGCFVVGGCGEYLPFAEKTFDLVVSFQVLEHVQNPSEVVHEVFRVLKPGGEAFLTYENYFGFREPHYGVFWLPLLPRAIGRQYLKLLGKDPTFFCEAITYTTFLSVRRQLQSAGFAFVHEELWRHAPGKKLAHRIAGVMRGKTSSLPASWRIRIDCIRRMMRTYTEEHLRRPLNS